MENDMMKIREVIRDKRKSLGITQEQMANKVGISRHHYLNFEKGKHSISDPFVPLVLKELNLVLLIIDKKLLE